MKSYAKPVLNLAIIFMIFGVGFGYSDYGALPDFVLAPDFCDRVLCTPPENCDTMNGVIIDGGGPGGCCKICAIYLDKDDQCSNDTTVTCNYDQIIPDDTYSQYINKNQCKKGLNCASGVCTPLKKTDSSACSSECVVRFYQPLDMIGTPTCKNDGTYAPKSCKGSSPRCFCVSAEGDTIFGRLPADSASITCEGSRAVNNLITDTTDVESEAVGYLIRLDRTGDFSKLQCMGEVCFCVNASNGVMTSSATLITGIKALPCWNSTLYNDTFYTTCEQEFLKMKALVLAFKIKGVTITPFEFTSCDPDGTYSPLQKSGTSYMCVDYEGNQIASYVAYDQQTIDTMSCKCARDQNYPTDLPDFNRERQCDSLGNYRKFYCPSGDLCCCIDTDGQQCTDYIYDSVTAQSTCGTTATPFCS